MKSNQPTPIWPYLLVLSSLFALGVGLPRGWESLARRDTIEAFLASTRPLYSRRLALAPRPATARDISVESLAATARPDEPKVDDSQFEADALPSQAEIAAANQSASLSVDAPIAHDEMTRSADAARPAESTAPRRWLATNTQWASLASSTEEAAEPAPPSIPRGSDARFVAPGGDAPTDDPAPEFAGDPEPPTHQPPPTYSAAPQRATETAAGNEGSAGGAPKHAATLFPLPVTLLAELDTLALEPRAADWARGATRLVHELCEGAPTDARPTAAVFSDLHRHCQQGEELAAAAGDSHLAIQLLRAQYGLARRLEIWQRVYELPAGELEVAASGQSKMPVALESVEGLTRAQRQGTAWREYLLLPRLQHALGRAEPKEERRRLARHVLARLSNNRLSREQRQFLSDQSLAEFRGELQRWAAEPVNRDEVLIDLERYEQSGSAVHAQRLATSCRSLCLSDDSASQQLGARLEEHYRNANVRVAVAAPLMQRFLPQPSAMVAPVRDRIAGADVAGQSTIYSQLKLLLIPDSKRLRVGLEVNGVVASNTEASSGPARFYTNGESQFTVRKLMLLGTQGLKVFPAQSEAQATRQELVSLETNFDRVPLVSSMVRSIARSEHRASEDEARSEVEQKVATRAKDQFDNEIGPRLAAATARFNERIREPLERLDLDPQAIGMSTTEDRAVIRFRLAGQDQLAAHTPRPRAPSDSLISLQIHQTALNNALERLELDGRTFSLPELLTHLSHKLGRSEMPMSDEVPHNVSVTFAAHDAVRVNCDQDQIEIRISLARLSERRKTWKNFTVRTYYKPDPSSLETRFVRSSGIFLDGDSLKGRTQLALRGVFSKILSPSHKWGLIDPTWATDPRLKDLEITQFTVDKGWIGLAYAPRRAPQPVASRPMVPASGVR